MGRIKNVASKIAKGVKIIAKAIAALPLLIKVFAILLVAATVIGAIDFVIELFTAKNTPDLVASTFNIEEDLSEIVEIRKSEDGSGYYLDFVSDFDEKVKEIVEQSEKKEGVHNIHSEELVKKIIKAELVMQFPNLGGNIPEESNGFQGAIDIRRITPKKEIGSVEDNPGRGDTTVIEEPDEVYDTVQTTASEEKIKTWEEGKKLVVKGQATVYLRKKSEINEEEY